MSNPITPVEPVDLVLFQSYARISTAEDASVVGLFISAARARAEHFTGRDFISKVKTKTYEIDEAVEVPVADIISVSGAITDIAKIDTAYNWWIEYVKGISVNRQHPINYNEKPTFTIKYNLIINPDDIEADVKIAICKIAADLYENRENSSVLANNKLQVKFETLLAPYKIY